MNLHSDNRFPRLPSIGIDAVSLDRYSDLETDDGDLIIYDEEGDERWIQSNVWLTAEELE